MKKVILSLGLLLCIGFVATAQESSQRVENSPLLTKNGYKYLPVAGDFAIGIDAQPYLQYLGNMFNNSTANDGKGLFNGVDNTIYGKYFLENNRAIRAKLRLNIYNQQFKSTVADDYATTVATPPSPNATAVDVDKVGTTDVELKVGYEFRRGHGRVQGFYGGEVGAGYASGSHSYEYGNPMTAANQAPHSTNWLKTGVAPYNNVPMSTRPTESKMGNSFSVYAGAFAGVEFFFAPQLSIGGELSIGLKYATKGQGETTSESFDAGQNTVVSSSSRSRVMTDVASEFGLKTKTEGNIFLMFYF